MSLIPIRYVAALAGFVGSTGWAQTFETLYSFPADGSDGKKPFATLTIGPDGAMYGTTTEGGVTRDEENPGDGTIFKVVLTELGPQVVILDDFEKETVGRSVKARLLNPGDGSLYGVSEYNGGTAGNPQGTLFKYTPGAAAGERFQVIFQVPSQGAHPKRPLTLTMGEPDVIHFGGYDPTGIWRIPLDPTLEKTAVLFDNSKEEGSGVTSLIRGADGFLYGTTRNGGEDSVGTLFRIAPDGTQPERLHSATRATGCNPIGAMVQAPDGFFYGVMEEGGGGTKGSNGCVYRLSPEGEYKIVTPFTRSGDMRYATGDLLLASDGYLYGTAWYGGTHAYGGVFRVKPDGSGYKILHSFNSTDGDAPKGGLVQAADGHLYGTTEEGGPGDAGTIFRIKLALPVNRPPVAIKDFAVSNGEQVDINVLANDFDADDDALVLTINTAPQHGTAVVRPGGIIRYTPDESYDGVDQFSYRITDPRGGTATATVQIRDEGQEPLPIAGLYNGLFTKDPQLTFEGDEQRGQFLLSVLESGRFSGVLLTQRKRVPFRGSFNDEGTAVVPLKLPGKRPAVLFLSIQAGSPNIILGALFGPEIWTGFSLPVKESAASTSEFYTLQLKANESVLPARGHGYGVMRVTPKGLVAAVGKLGDGTRFSWGTTLVAGEENSTGIPVFSVPVPGGYCGGVLLPAVQTGLNFSGAVRWHRPGPKAPYPNGINGTVEVTAAKFVAPARNEPVLNLEEGLVKFSDGPQADLQGGFVLDGAKVRVNSQLRALTFSRKTGLFSGRLQLGSSRKTILFQGVVHQDLKTGVGQYISSKITYGVDLTPAESIR